MFYSKWECHEEDHDAVDQRQNQLHRERNCCRVAFWNDLGDGEDEQEANKSEVCEMKGIDLIRSSKTSISTGTSKMIEPLTNVPTMQNLLKQSFWGLYHKTYYGRNLRFP